MKTVATRSFRKAGRPVQNAGPNRFESDISTALIGCMVMSLLPLCTVGAQSKPDAQRARQAAKAPNSRTTAPTEALAAEHSSPNADYAIDSLLSRTAPNDSGDNTDTNVSDILARRLWQNRMSAPDPDEDAETRRALQSLISRVQSIRFAGSEEEPALSAPATPGITPPARVPNTRIDATPTAPTPLPSTPVSSGESLPALEPATLERLENLLQDPNQVGAPLDMAELLFLSGRPTEAAVFYEKALAQMTPSDPRLGEDRAWVLFQLGNCLRETDMGRAKDTYMKLIAQYPGSPWTELAKAHGRLITWYQGTQPQQWMPTQESP